MSPILPIESLPLLQGLAPQKSSLPSEALQSDAVLISISRRSYTLSEREKHLNDYEEGRGYLSGDIARKIALDSARAPFNLAPRDLYLYGSYKSALRYRGRVNLSEAVSSLAKTIGFLK